MERKTSLLLLITHQLVFSLSLQHLLGGRWCSGPPSRRAPQLRYGRWLLLHVHQCICSWFSAWAGVRGLSYTPQRQGCFSGHLVRNPLRGHISQLHSCNTTWTPVGRPWCPRCVASLTPEPSSGAWHPPKRFCPLKHCATGGRTWRDDHMSGGCPSAACCWPSFFPGCAQISPVYLNSHLFSHKIRFSPAALCCYDNRLALLLLSHPCFSCIRTLPLILQPCSEDMTSSFNFCGRIHYLFCWQFL